MKLFAQGIFIAALLTFSVAEAKKTNTRAPANAPEHGVFCGVLSIGSYGHDNVSTYTIVDQPANGRGQYFNAGIPQDAEILADYGPRPGDSDPKSPDFVDHGVSVGHEKVWMLYAGDFFTNSELSHGKCICVSGDRSVIDGRSYLQSIAGYAIRNGKCSGISQQAVARFAAHQN